MSCDQVHGRLEAYVDARVGARAWVATPPNSLPFLRGAQQRSLAGSFDQLPGPRPSLGEQGLTEPVRGALHSLNSEERASAGMAGREGGRGTGRFALSLQREQRRTLRIMTPGRHNSFAAS